MLIQQIFIEWLYVSGTVLCARVQQQTKQTQALDLSLKSNYIAVHSCKTSVPCAHTNSLLIAYLEKGMTFATGLSAVVMMPLQLH